MIFLTVGTQGSFDRLVRTVDAWARDTGQNVFAQTGISSYRPSYIESKPFIEPAEFRRNVEQADLLVAHAGMGSIITALEFGKQVLVMPRLSRLGEHRNDHQVATARRLSELGLVAAAYDEAELRSRLDHLGSVQEVDRLKPVASSTLIETIRQFVEQGAAPLALAPATS